MTFQFVEEGKWSKDAEIIKLKVFSPQFLCISYFINLQDHALTLMNWLSQSQFGEAKAKELKAKQAQLAKAKAEPDINPNLIEVGERVITKEKPKESIPDVEWW